MALQQKVLFVVGGVAALGLAYWAGMRRPVAETPSASSASVTASSAAPPLASAATAPPGSAAGLEGLDLASRLAGERATAGKGNPSADAVFTAIQKKLSLPIEDRLQVAAWSIGAQFCERANTKAGVYVVVCEYKDAESAAKGQKASTNNVVKRREVLTLRTSTCAVHQTSETPEAVAEAKRIKDLYLAM